MRIIHSIMNHNTVVFLWNECSLIAVVPCVFAFVDKNVLESVNIIQYHSNLERLPFLLSSSHFFFGNKGYSILLVKCIILYICLIATKAIVITNVIDNGTFAPPVANMCCYT